MRFDISGLFWNDVKPPKISKAKDKVQRTPPDPVWLRDDYLPHLDEASSFQPDLFSDEELVQASLRGERLVWDIESYPNFFSIGFQSIVSGKSLVFKSTDATPDFDKRKLDWVLRNFVLIDFNGEHYDRHIANIAVKPGTDCSHMYMATQRIIEFGERGWQVCRAMGAKKIYIDHIDLIELTPLAPSLKTMAGRIGSPMMMDLPFKPGTFLSEPQQIITMWYMFNDLRNTQLLYLAHLENIELREEFGKLYGIDLRSKSDAQMAEAIFRAEFHKRTGRYAEPPQIRPGHKFQFDMPHWVRFLTLDLQLVKQTIENAWFEIEDTGYVKMPEGLANLVIPIGNMKYKMGIGGLHSQEETIAHYAGTEFILRDHDVASYYPKLILGSGKYPPAIGSMFVPLYGGIVDMRLAAKAAKEMVKANGLKIVVNGSFGKTMDPWSVLYCPELGMQTTISGQLALLMMIERAHIAGFEITNANTDGVVIKCRKDQEAELKAVVKQWEAETGLEMEATDYVATFSRDVNNYIAVKADGKVKSKGVYGETTIKKNPQMEICSDAVSAFVSKGTPIQDTILACRDINKFVSVRNVRGGCAKVYPERTEYVGKVARWYYPKDEAGEIVTVSKGHLVPTTEGARPIMRYSEFPDDVDYEKYIAVATEQLAQLGVTLT
jgi:hypothetical protein